MTVKPLHSNQWIVPSLPPFGQATSNMSLQSKLRRQRAEQAGHRHHKSQMLVIMDRSRPYQSSISNVQCTYETKSTVSPTAPIGANTPGPSAPRHRPAAAAPCAPRAPPYGSPRQDPPEACVQCGGLEAGAHVFLPCLNQHNNNHNHRLRHQLLLPHYLIWLLHLTASPSPSAAGHAYPNREHPHLSPSRPRLWGRNLPYSDLASSPPARAASAQRPAATSKKHQDILRTRKACTLSSSTRPRSTAQRISSSTSQTRPRHSNRRVPVSLSLSLSSPPPPSGTDRLPHSRTRGLSCSLFGFHR